ncbi:MAG: biotin-dependent carboxyltransferase family protein [Pseudomonadota bacterium]
MLRIVKPGLQTSLQGAPRIGHRAFGIPAAGPADPVSMALANRLVGNASTATCLEITYGGFAAIFECEMSFAITGAVGAITLQGAPVEPHQTLYANSGDWIEISPPVYGARAYLAVPSGFVAQTHFGSASTYLPAQLGGHEGRALQADDVLTSLGGDPHVSLLRTPDAIRPVFTHAFGLRASVSAETRLLTDDARDALFSETFTAGRQATRMGIEFTGHKLEIQGDGLMKSAPVFPGTIQCPQSGHPIALSCDAQTTGGYPRIAHIAECDRHLLGQIRPGNSIVLLHRSPREAVEEGLKKRALLQDWLLTRTP